MRTLLITGTALLLSPACTPTPQGVLDALGSGGDDAKSELTQRAIVTGDIVMLPSPPPDVSEDVLESDEMIFGFVEQLGLILDTDVAVDIVEPGVYENGFQLTRGEIPAGTRVNCFFLHSDPEQNGLAGTRLSGTITFPSQVLGIIVQSQDLNRSDETLGAAGTVYTTNLLSDLLRGTEFEECPIELSADRKTVHVCMRSVLSRDQMRIITLATQRRPALESAAP